MKDEPALKHTIIIVIGCLYIKMNDQDVSLKIHK